MDVNDYTEEELLEEKTFLSKAMLIESKSNSSDIVECLDKIIDIVNVGDRYSQKQRNLLLIMLDIILRTKINNNEETNRLIEKIKIGGEDEMLALVDNIKRENRRLINQGKREGRKEGRIEIIKNMKLENLPVELIIKITGLSKEEIEKL